MALKSSTTIYQFWLHINHVYFLNFLNIIFSLCIWSPNIAFMQAHHRTHIYCFNGYFLCKTRLTDCPVHSLSPVVLNRSIHKGKSTVSFPMATACINNLITFIFTHLFKQQWHCQDGLSSNMRSVPEQKPCRPNLSPLQFSEQWTHFPADTRHRLSRHWV